MRCFQIWLTVEKNYHVLKRNSYWEKVTHVKDKSPCFKHFLDENDVIRRLLVWLKWTHLVTATGSVLLKSVLQWKHECNKCNKCSNAKMEGDGVWVCEFVFTPPPPGHCGKKLTLHKDFFPFNQWTQTALLVTEVPSLWVVNSVFKHTVCQQKQIFQ